MQSRECVDVVVARYPDRRQRISSLYEHNATFREVCADYHTASSSLDEVRRRAANRPGDEHALLALLADLEGEIEQYLDPAEPPPPTVSWHGPDPWARGIGEPANGVFE